MFVVELCLLSSSAMDFKMKVNIRNRRLRLGLVYGAKRHFQQYFNYIKAELELKKHIDTQKSVGRRGRNRMVTISTHLNKNRLLKHLSTKLDKNV
jgi:hypothetical protein